MGNRSPDRPIYLLLHKFPAPAFTVTTRLEFEPRAPGETAGRLIFGYNHAWIGLRATGPGAAVVLALRSEAAKDGPHREHLLIDPLSGPVWLCAVIRAGGQCRSAFSTDGVNFRFSVGEVAARSADLANGERILF